MAITRYPFRGEAEMPLVFHFALAMHGRGEIDDRMTGTDEVRERRRNR